MPRVNRDTLRKEQEEDEALEKSFNNNPVKAEIQRLFQNEFSGMNYRKLGGIDKVKEMAVSRLKEVASSKPGPWSSAVVNLTSKIGRAKAYEDVLMAMNDYLFS
jgi:hypothetical protein